MTTAPSTAANEPSAAHLAEAMRLWVEAGGGTLPVSGVSMRPTFEDPARVWMVPARSARFGDLIVYSDGALLVVHRVVGVRKGMYRTKGDGLPHLDPNPVGQDRLLGRAIEIERGGRRIRIDGSRERAYARLVAAISASEGFLYRFAYRLDRAAGRVFGGRGRTETKLTNPPPSSSEIEPSRPGASGPMLLRRALDRTGRLAMTLLDRTFFTRLNPRSGS